RVDVHVDLVLVRILVKDSDEDLLIVGRLKLKTVFLGKIMAADELTVLVEVPVATLALEFLKACGCFSAHVDELVTDVEILVRAPGGLIDVADAKDALPIAGGRDDAGQADLATLENDTEI